MRKTALMQSNWQAVALIKLARNEVKSRRLTVTKKVAKVAKGLGKSERSIWRLLKASREQGVEVIYR